jgi:hypothetical protein
MNAPDRKIMNAVACTKAAWFLGAAALAILLSGCTGLVASAKVDPKSPIAPEVARLASADKDFPSFNEIPPKPTDLQAPKVYGERACELLTARARLETATAPSTWTLGNTTSFLARAQADAGPALGPPTNADTEAFANAIRKRATPPPPATH